MRSTSISLPSTSDFKGVSFLPVEAEYLMVIYAITIRFVGKRGKSFSAFEDPRDWKKIILGQLFVNNRRILPTNFLMKEWDED